MGILAGLMAGAALFFLITRQIVRESAEKPRSAARRWGARLYFLSFCLLLIYAAGMVLLSWIADSDQFVLIYQTHPTGFIYMAGVSMIISSLILILSGEFERGVALIVFPSLMLLAVVLVAPVISYLSGDDAPLASLKHGDHRYFVAPLPRDSDFELFVVECDSLGLICRKLPGETVLIGFVRDENAPHDRLEFDSAQNALIWWRNDEMIGMYEPSG